MSSAPAYAQIGEALRTSIASGQIAPGTVLLEGSLARLFGASRSPVKQALNGLVAEGLVSHFNGRGLVVGDGSAPVRRTPVQPSQFGAQFAGITKAWAWQHLYAEVEKTLTLHCVLGQFQVNEVELATHHNIGRTVARDVLIRMQATGIITKDSRARWVTVPLDDRRVSDLYELREFLEPRAVAGAIGRIKPATLRDMLGRLDAVAADYPNVEAGDLDQLEHDLHVDIAGHTANAELPAALMRTRCIIISSKHILDSVAALPETDPFLLEHRRVIEAVAANDAGTVMDTMVAHLRSARDKVLTRLQGVREKRVLPGLTYLQWIG